MGTAMLTSHDQPWHALSTSVTSNKLAFSPSVGVCSLRNQILFVSYQFGVR